uniref:DNA-directed RNA polymerase II subunit RPB7 n=1 Tax=Chlamydomonas euryale TaxID=1486919 RepID=A0A7R9YT63_9CHLO|mmetsp:Transcript_17946/g.53758  ORF Transcript_17946/g.53758 Transcript_17946/m.53758 type:complete len:177 (+) Transcript_17946:148-678(+)
MFYVLYLAKDLDVHPRHFGKNLRDEIERKLNDEVEGKCHGKYGYVVCVISVSSIGKGKIRQDGTGYATFKVHYSAVVCRPYIDEVVDVVVTSVNKAGFFAQAGPYEIFVSNHLIPEDYEFNTVGEPCYTSNEDGAQTVQERTEVRLRIVGTNLNQAEIFCIGSMKGDFLGVISAAP